MSFLNGVQFLCGVCRIGLYSMYKYLCCKRPAAAKETYNILCLGLANSGKSTLLAVATDDDQFDPQPTIGFNIRPIVLTRHILNVKEIGGSDKVRPYWNRYYAGGQFSGVLFCISATTLAEDKAGVVALVQQVLDDAALSALPAMLLCTVDTPAAAPPAPSVDESALLAALGQRAQRLLVHTCSIRHKAHILAALNQFAAFIADRATRAAPTHPQPAPNQL